MAFAIGNTAKTSLRLTRHLPTPKGASIPNVPAPGHPQLVRGPVEIRVDPRLANGVQRALFRR
jgi:hypothetical protein